MKRLRYAGCTVSCPRKPHFLCVQETTGSGLESHNSPDQTSTVSFGTAAPARYIYNPHHPRLQTSTDTATGDAPPQRQQMCESPHLTVSTSDTPEQLQAALKTVELRLVETLGATALASLEFRREDLCKQMHPGLVSRTSMFAAGQAPCTFESASPVVLQVDQGANHVEHASVLGRSIAPGLSLSQTVTLQQLSSRQACSRSDLLEIIHASGLRPKARGGGNFASAPFN